jgi:hypothetical protein
MAPKDEGPKAHDGPRGFTIVGEGEAGPEKERGEPLALNFGTFVLSLSTSALVSLGDAPHPETGKPALPNLPLARQTIDILEMISEKTRGNLDPDEKRLLEAVLHDLHMRFVRAGSDRKD